MSRVIHLIWDRGDINKRSNWFDHQQTLDWRSWRQHDVLLTHDNVAALWLPKYGTTTEPQFASLLDLTLAVTSQYTNAFVHFDEVLASIWDTLVVRLQVAPSDPGLSTYLRVVDQRCYMYSVVFSCEPRLVLSIRAFLTDDWSYSIYQQIANIVRTPADASVELPARIAVRYRPQVSIIIHTASTPSLVDLPHLDSGSPNAWTIWNNTRLLPHNRYIYHDTEAVCTATASDETARRIKATVASTALSVRVKQIAMVEDRWCELLTNEYRPPPPRIPREIFLHWLPFAPIRRAHQSLVVIELVLRVHSLCPPQDLLCVLDLVPTMRYCPRAVLDRMVMNTYRSIRAVLKYRDSPACSTRSRKPPRINTAEQVSL